MSVSQIEYIGNGNPDGTSLGYSTSEKISVYGKTPIIQRANANQAIVATTAVVSSTSAIWGFGSSQATAIITLVNELRAALIAFGIIKGSA